MSARLADIMMALTSGALRIGAHALGTCAPSCIGRPDRIFFMLDARGPQEIVGHAVVAPEPSR
jgi:hypothetical protein